MPRKSGHNLKFQWDNGKAEKNFHKHGVSFDEGSTVFFDPMSRIFDDPTHSIRERREIART